MTDSWETLTNDVLACRRCPRLVEWREQVARDKRKAYRDWVYWGKPVPAFGDPQAKVLVVGLAPGAHGSNRTGRMFTGDSSGDTLYAALHAAGFANQPTSTDRDDGLVLTDALVNNIGRCVPPGNKPTAEELRTCRPFFERELALLADLKVIVALGGLAFDASLKLLREIGYDIPRHKFGHATHVSLTPPDGYGPRHILGCYHPSRQNTQTGRLTQAMINAVFQTARTLMQTS